MVKTPQLRQWGRSSLFNINLERVQLIYLVLLTVALNWWLFAE